MWCLGYAFFYPFVKPQHYILKKDLCKEAFYKAMKFWKIPNFNPWNSFILIQIGCFIPTLNIKMIGLLMTHTSRGVE